MNEGLPGLLHRHLPSVAALVLLPSVKELSMPPPAVAMIYHAAALSHPILHVCRTHVPDAIRAALKSVWIDRENVKSWIECAELEGLQCPRFRYLQFDSTFCGGQTGDRDVLIQKVRSQLRAVGFSYEDARIHPSMQLQAGPTLVSVSFLSLIDAGVLALLSQCTHLRYLQVVAHDATGLELVLRTCVHLTAVHVTGRVPRQIYLIVEHCGARLREVTIRKDDRADEIATLPLACPELRVVRDATFNYTATALLAESGLRLTAVKMMNFESSRYPRFELHFASLQRIAIDSWIDDDALISLAQHCPCLQHMMAELCCVSDAGVCQLASSCKALRVVRFSNVRGRHMTDAAVSAIARNCRNLERLEVDGRHGTITDDGILALAKHCRGLLELKISLTSRRWSQRITAVSMSALRASNPWCWVDATISSCGCRMWPPTHQDCFQNC